MRSTARPLVVLATALVALALLLPTAAGAAASRSPQAQANKALAKLAADTKKLSRKAATKRNRRALLRTLKAAQKSAKKNPCRSMKTLAAYRKALRKKVKVRKLKGRAPDTQSERGRLDSEALAANVALMALPKAKKCGGGKVSTVAEPTTTVERSDERQLRLNVKLPKPAFVSQRAGGQEFQQVVMDGMGESGDVGKPGLPQESQFFGVPVGADVKVTVEATQGYDLKDVNLYPHQESAVDIALPPGAPDQNTFLNPPFKLDTKAYNAKGQFPAAPADGANLGTLRGLQIGGVDLAGGQYNPKTDTLHVFTSIDVTIAFGGGNQGNFGDPGLFKSPWNAHFFNNYKRVINNYDTVIGHLGDFRPHPFCGEEMLIVTSPELKPAADTFAAARGAAGFLARVALVGSAPGQIGTTNTEIQTYIRNELNRTDCFIHPAYVVLFGNIANVPTFLVPCSPGGDVAACNIASDLPYSLDGIGSDLFADVMLGRIPAANLDAANAVVTKIVNYETTMPAPAGDDFYHHATVTGYFQPALICVLNDGASGAPNCDSDHPPVNAHWEIDYSNHRDTRGFTITAERIKQAMDFNSYTTDRLFTTDDAMVNPLEYWNGTPIPSNLRRPAFAWDADTTDFLNAYNGGRFLILHRDHGWPDGWAEPTLHSGHVPGFTNGAKLPVVFGINCASGAFDDPAHPSFVELQVMKPDGGAFAGFGDTRVSPSFPNNHMALGFFDALFPNTVPDFGSDTPTRRLGDVLLSGKGYMASQEGFEWHGAGDTYVEHYLYHLLGDPSAQMWAAEPQHFDPSKVISRYITRASGPPWEIQIQLPVGGGDPPPEGTILTLLQNGQAIGKAIAGGDGTATITPEVNVDPTNLKIALDQDGALPGQDDVEGIPQPPQKAATSMSITCPSGGKVQGTSAVSGNLTGAPAQSTVHVKWTPPGQPSFTHDVTTDANGHWLDRSPTNFSGQWSVDATYDEDNTHQGSTANCGFPVT